MNISLKRQPTELKDSDVIQGMKTTFSRKLNEEKDTENEVVGFYRLRSFKILVMKAKTANGTSYRLTVSNFMNELIPDMDTYSLLSMADAFNKFNTALDAIYAREDKN